MFAAAVEQVRAGGLVAYPTETVFGLGADATSAEAVARLRAWKGRGADQPISVLVHAPAALAEIAEAEHPAALALAARFWPGPLTLVVRAAGDRFAAGIAREDGAVGVRCSPDATACGLARALAEGGVGPITATSLNRSGEPPVADAEAAAALCERHPGPLLVAATSGQDPVPCAAGEPLPSTVVDCTAAGFRLIREGAIPASALAAALQ